MEFFGKVGPGETWYLWSLATYESVLIVQKRCAHKKVKKSVHTKMSGAFRIFSECSIALMLTFANIFSSIYVKNC